MNRIELRRCRPLLAVTALLGGLAVVPAAVAQHLDGYEAPAYDASDTGTIITGQPLFNPFYIPVADSQHGLVYTYAANALGMPVNPTGGAQFVGSTGGDPALPVPFSRAQQDVSYPALAFRISYDICVNKQGDPLTSDNVGSFSTQRTAGGSDFGHIDLVTWTDPVTAANWDPAMVWFDEGGGELNEDIPDFAGLATNHWYRRSTTLAGDTNRIVELSITDLTTGTTTTVLPVDRYAVGGRGGFDQPVGFRFFAGCSAGDCTEGNTIGWDNVTITAIPPTGSCCLPDTGDCVDNVDTLACSNMNGVFNGIGTKCEATMCFELTEDGWVVDAPIIWIGATCDNGDDCDLRDGEDEQWVVNVPWDQTWTFSVCDDADFDTYMYLGTSGCTFFEENDDCVSGSDSEISANITAGTYYVTLEAFAGDCGDFVMTMSADCPLVPDNPECIEESGDVCMDEDTDPANVGCNAVDPQAPTFDDMSCGETRCGTVGNFTLAGDGRRDLDWYRLEVAETSTITMTAIGSFPEVVIFLATLNNADLDGSGTVDFGDILRILAAWGNPGGIEDLDLSGVVAFGDILQILASWGETVCDGAGVVLTSFSTADCAETAEYAIEVGPGIYAPIIASDFADPSEVPCGDASSYEFTVTCTP